MIPKCIDKRVGCIRMIIFCIGVGEVEFNVSKDVAHYGRQIISVVNNFGSERSDRILGAAMSLEPCHM